MRKLLCSGQVQAGRDFQISNVSSPLCSTRGQLHSIMSSVAAFLLSENLPHFRAHLDKSISAVVTVYERYRQNHPTACLNSPVTNEPRTSLQHWTRDGCLLPTPGADALRDTLQEQNPSVVYVIYQADGEASSESDLDAIAVATEGSSVVLLLNNTCPPHYVAILRKRFRAIRVLQHAAARLIFAAEMAALRPRPDVISDPTMVWKGSLELCGKERTLPLSSFELHCLRVQHPTLVGRELPFRDCTARLLAAADAMPLFGTYLRAHVAFEMRLCAGTDENTAKFVNAWVHSRLSLLIELHDWRLWCFWRREVADGLERLICRALVVPEIPMEMTMAMAESCVSGGEVRSVPKFVDRLPAFDIHNLLRGRGEGKDLVDGVEDEVVAGGKNSTHVVPDDYAPNLLQRSGGGNSTSPDVNGGGVGNERNFQEAFNGFVSRLLKCPRGGRCYGEIGIKSSEGSPHFGVQSAYKERNLGQQNEGHFSEGMGRRDEDVCAEKKFVCDIGSDAVMSLDDYENKTQNAVENRLESKGTNVKKIVNTASEDEHASAHEKHVDYESEEAQVAVAVKGRGGRTGGNAECPVLEESNLDSCMDKAVEQKGTDHVALLEGCEADTKLQIQPRGMKRSRTPLIVETQPLPGLPCEMEVNGLSLSNKIFSSLASLAEGKRNTEVDMTGANRIRTDVIVIMDSPAENGSKSLGTSDPIRIERPSRRTTACGVESEFKSVRTSNTDSILTGQTRSQRSRTEVEDTRAYRDKLIRQRYERLSRGRQSEGNLLRSMRRTYPDRMEQRAKRARVNHGESYRKTSSNNFANIASAHVKVSNLLESAEPFFDHNFDCLQTEQPQCPESKQWRCMCDTQTQVLNKIAGGEYEYPRTARHGMEFAQDEDIRDEYLTHYEKLVGHSGREFASMVKRLDSRALSRLDRAVRKLVALGARQHMRGTAHDHAKVAAETRKLSDYLPRTGTSVRPEQITGFGKSTQMSSAITGKLLVKTAPNTRRNETDDRRDGSYAILTNTFNARGKEARSEEVDLIGMPIMMSRYSGRSRSSCDVKPSQFEFVPDYSLSTAEDSALLENNRAGGDAQIRKHGAKGKRHKLVMQVLLALKNGEFGDDDKRLLLQNLIGNG